MTEDPLQQDTLAWLQSAGYALHSGFDLAPDGPAPGKGDESVFS